jgi:hypothetical protein
MTRPLLHLAILRSVDPVGISTQRRVRFRSGGFVGTETAWVALAAGELAFLFCELVPRVSLLVFLLVLAAIDDKNRFTFK